MQCDITLKAGVGVVVVVTTENRNVWTQEDVVVVVGAAVATPVQLQQRHGAHVQGGPLKQTIAVIYRDNVTGSQKVKL